ncbi:acetyltransferase [Roseateles amylovorans]|uniref:Acetyltransferase n=1 Tax=Roseateles amylovorans TaxID=2978473 RepID=A0ABY6AY68_9BURK|nr:acetyltransferase [Roseateles amylovorans]UXH77627.1 acetyltransferase [Roseateles amylovorans]
MTMELASPLHVFAEDAPPLILLGAGGHAKVVASLATATGRRLAGVCDPSLHAAGVTEWRGLPVLGADDALTRFTPKAYELALGIGIVPGSRLRGERYRALNRLGYRFPALIHPRAMVDASACIEEGVQIMAGAIVQADTRIGCNTIVNTGVAVDHDGNVGEHVHLAPGVVLCGGVRVGDDTFIGASATLLPLVAVGRGCLVAAGSTLARALADGDAYLPHRQAATASRGRLPSLD